MASGTENDPVAYARERLRANSAAVVLLAEVERGRARRRSPDTEHPGRAGQADSAEPPLGAAGPGTSSDGFTWCIACQRMVPYADWSEHVTHSQAVLNRQRPGNPSGEHGTGARD